MAKILFAVAIAHGTFFANPTWGAEGLPRDASGNVIVNRWIQPGESFWFNPAAWVHTYQHYCHPVDSAPKIEVDLPDPAAPDAPSTEEQKPEPAEPAPAPEATPEPAPAPDQAEPAPKPAPKKKSTPKPKAAEPAPAPEATPDPAPDQADQADPQE